MHKYEPVLLLAHRDSKTLQRGLKGVTVRIEPSEPVLDCELALTDSSQIQYGTDNVFKSIDIEKGDAAAVFEDAPHVIEGTYRTGSQEHVYLETQGVIAFDETASGGRLIIHGSMQCPYYVVEALRVALGYKRDSLQIIPSAIGGGFGGKEEYPSMVAAHAAVLAGDDVGVRHQLEDLRPVVLGRLGGYIDRIGGIAYE